MKIYKILLIDDEELFRKAQMRLLSSQSIIPNCKFRCTECGSGKEGEKFIESSEFDCVIIDHDMPDGNGIYWLNHFLMRWSNLPVIMVTGHGCEQTAVEAMKAGSMDYLVKGQITVEMLVKSILSCIQRSEMQRVIEEQKRQLFAAERQRVMIESLGAACHHLAQPLNVLSLYLEMIESAELDMEKKEMLQSCIEASSNMTNIIDKLRCLQEYHTEPYIRNENGQYTNILKI